MYHVWFINAISLNTEPQCSAIDSKCAGWICATIWRDQNSIQVAMVPQASQALPCSPSPHRSTHLLNRFYFHPFVDSHDLLRHVGRCCRSQLAGDRRQDPCSLALIETQPQYSTLGLCLPHNNSPKRFLWAFLCTLVGFEVHCESYSGKFDVKHWYIILSTSINTYVVFI